MPMALRTAGRWIGKMRKMSSHFRSGIDAMVREAELEEMERKWREQNEAIMQAHPNAPLDEMSADAATAEAGAEAGAAAGASAKPADPAAAPQLPLTPP
jgi:sec-independent protein translocase protein TatB